MVNIFEPKPPHLLLPDAAYIGLVSFEEMILIHATVKSINKSVKDHHDRMMIFGDLMRDLGIDPPDDGEVDITIDPALVGFGGVPECRVILRGNYDAYWEKWGSDNKIVPNIENWRYCGKKED